MRYNFKILSFFIIFIQILNYISSQHLDSIYLYLMQLLGIQLNYSARLEKQYHNNEKYRNIKGPTF